MPTSGASSSTARARATKIRKLVLADAATAEQRHWLQRYESERLRQPRGARGASGARAPRAPALNPRPASPAAPAPAAAVPETQNSTAHAEHNTAPSPSTLGEMVRLEIPDAKPAGETAKAAGVSPSQCSIPDCPKCKRTGGALICGVTNEKVYAPMSEMGAAFLAATMLAIISKVVQFLRPDRQLVPPTEKEKLDMAKAIREVAHRRVNVVGAIDDLLMLGGATTQYTLRAVTEPDKEPPKPEQPVTIQNAMVNSGPEQVS